MQERKEGRRKVLAIFEKPTILTADAVDPTVLSLAMGTRGILSLTILLRREGVYYAERRREEEAIRGDSESQVSTVTWSWVSKHTGNQVYAIREDLRAMGIIERDVAESISVIASSETQRLLDENDTIMIY